MFGLLKLFLRHCFFLTCLWNITLFEQVLEGEGKLFVYSSVTVIVTGELRLNKENGNNVGHDFNTLLLNLCI